MAAYSPALSSESLDRSPSLSSNSSGASSTHSAITPALGPTSTFPSLSCRDEPSSTNSYSYQPPTQSHPLRSIKGSIGSLASLSKNRDNGSPPPAPRTWVPAHRAGTMSFDSSSRRRTGSLAVRDGNSLPSSSSSPNGSTTSNETIAAWRSSTTPERPSSQQLPPVRSPSLDTTRPSSPSAPSSPSRVTSRNVASSIFAGVPSPSSPGSSGGRTGGWSGTHKRSMTLPQLGMGGLPIPSPTTGNGGEEVVGLQGRLRLSRPAESSSLFAPSAVFGSSHALSRTAGSGSNSPSSTPSGNISAPKLLPSQTVRAIDRQRQDLVAYEYLCHVAEAKEWLTSIVEDGPPKSQLEAIESIGEFEQSLRSGYAIAHLARRLGGEACSGPIFNEAKRVFKHIGNINIFFQFIKKVELPEIFRFETVDLYEAKNLPKVIYCLHALSHLLARRGLAQRMTNLVGQIEFTDDEVNATQRDLNNAGIRMPNFKGVGNALARQINEEPEQESAEEIKAKARAAAAIEEEKRLRAEAEAARILAEEQARARAEAEERRRVLEERRRLEREEQDRIRVEEERRREEERLLEERKRSEEKRRREEERLLEERKRSEEKRLRLLEEERRRAEQERLRVLEEERLSAIEEEKERLRVEEARQKEAIRQAGITLVGFQAHARGALARRPFFQTIEQLGDHEFAFIGLQAHVRGVLARRRYDYLVQDLGAVTSGVIGLQATLRGILARRNLLERIRRLRSTDGVMIQFQAQIRGILTRRAFAQQAKQLRRVEVVRSIGGLQNIARAALVKRKIEVRKKELGFVLPNVIGLQAQVRGYLAREAYYDWYQHMQNSLDEIIDLQALIRGFLARRRFNNLRGHFKVNLTKFVGFQAAIRSRKQGSQYRQLRMGTNVPVGTIKNFVRLLDDSEFDYRGELQVEALKKELVTAIRETQSLEDDVKDLDTKIELLVKNKITHEVARAQRATSGGLGANVRGSLLSAANDPFGEHSLDRQAQIKLGLYQELFGLLQTSPKYLARLMSSTNGAGMSERTQKAVENTSFMIFGYAQNQREEYLLLKLFQRSIREELNSLPDLVSFNRVNFPFIRLLLQYGRGASQRKYLTDVLTHPVQAIVESQHLDLDCDPVSLYRADIAHEETRTGQTSRRPVDVTYEQALADAATKKTLIDHLIALRKTTDGVLNSLLKSADRVPFGIRYVGREVFRALQVKFPNESEEDVMRVVAHLVYYRFLQPAIVAPETFDIIQGVVPPAQRKNLADTAKMLNQISIGRLFSTERPYMVPMNDYISKRAIDFSHWMRAVINVDDAETHYHADEYLDVASARRPVIYISPNNIYTIHDLIASNLEHLAPEKNDPLRKIVAGLGNAPISSTAELTRARADEVALTLLIRIRSTDDPAAASKALFNQAKRRVLSILKVHHGNDLEAVLAQVVTQEDEDAWVRIVEEEEAEERHQAQQQRRRIIPLSDDIRSLSFHQLKQAALQDILQLRKLGVVDRADKYQTILNAIASDIRSKHHRRIQRQQELANMKATLNSLQKKKKYLDDQKQDYLNYIHKSMMSIQKPGGKKRLVLPWSMQGIHQRQLEKQGKSYQFGSYKYSAQDLYDRGILLSIDQYSPKQFNTISLTVSCDEIGVFEVGANVLGINVAKVELTLENLLESQAAGKQTILIGDIAKANLNLLIHLLNRKFTK